MMRQSKLFITVVTLALLTAMVVGCAGPTTTPTSTSRIAFSTDRDGNVEIYVMDADGSNPTNLTNNPADDLWPAWSP